MKILQAIKEKNGDSEIRAKNEKFLWPTRLPSKLRNCFDRSSKTKAESTDQT